MLHQKHGPARTSALTNWLLEEDAKPLKCSLMCNIPEVTFSPPPSFSDQLVLKNKDWHPVADLRAFQSWLLQPQKQFLFYEKWIQKQQKKKCIFRDCFSIVSLQHVPYVIYCRLIVGFLSFLLPSWFNCLGEIGPRNSFWCWDAFKKSTGDPGQRKDWECRYKSTAGYSSTPVFTFPPHKNHKYCDIACFWKAPSPNCQHTSNT